ncbi:TPA: prolyl oligopeptidase family serine peptidase [Escherichia coli]|nr:prolyl oligopeptidase family serine peptidase [Escherichia coli]
MPTRREFLIKSVAGALIVSMPRIVFANTNNKAINATAITQVFGDGVRLIAIAVEFEKPINKEELSTTEFSVKNYHINKIFISQSTALVEAKSGKYVILELEHSKPQNEWQETITDPTIQKAAPKQGQGKPTWVAGEKLNQTIRYKDASAAVVTQNTTLKTNAVSNLVVDSFRQDEYKDKESGKILKYNFFIPEEQNKSLPLVLFMHDAGATSAQVTTTLFQGVGAVIWAEPEEQMKRPCYVLAPQYNEIIADDDWRTSTLLDTTINLVQYLVKEYKIDPERIYVTGQSGGCMLAIAMNIKYPDFFTASYLVAGKWDAEQVAPIAKNKLWFMASEDDSGAFPSFNAITERLEQFGGKVSRAAWNGQWDPEQYRFAADTLFEEQSNIRYTVFIKDSVFDEYSSREGASGHRNTWRIAYSIEPIREWLFNQRKQ